MFKLFRTDPLEKLKKQYSRKLEEARDAQRSGKIPQYANLIAESEAIADQIDDLRRRQAQAS
ncbi:MAG: DUF6435 family protein [Acidobacteriota bacterium]